MKRVWLVGAVAVGLALSSAGWTQARKANPQIELTIAGRGKIVLEMFPQDAPKTVAHMLDLCKRKFYDGILVHRVEPGFVVQAGDPKTKTLTSSEMATMTDDRKAVLRIGAGGSGRSIPFEANSKTHAAGTMAMALSAPRSATGDSQWFINLEANHQLDGDYCVFGKVVKGMPVVKAIRVGDKITSMSVVGAGEKKPAASGDKKGGKR